MVLQKALNISQGWSNFSSAGAPELQEEMAGAPELQEETEGACGWSMQHRQL